MSENAVTADEVRKIMKANEIVRMEYEDSTGVVLFYQPDDSYPFNARSLDERSVRGKACEALEKWMLSTGTRNFQ